MKQVARFNLGLAGILILDLVIAVPVLAQPPVVRLSEIIPEQADFEAVAAELRPGWTIEDYRRDHEIGYHDHDARWSFALISPVRKRYRDPRFSPKFDYHDKIRVSISVYHHVKTGSETPPAKRMQDHVQATLENGKDSVVVQGKVLIGDDGYYTLLNFKNQKPAPDSARLYFRRGPYFVTVDLDGMAPTAYDKKSYGYTDDAIPRLADLDKLGRFVAERLPNEPMIILLHGVNGLECSGDIRRQPGWSDDVTTQWGIAVRNSKPGRIYYRDPKTRLPMFVREITHTNAYAGDSLNWSQEVQRELATLVGRANSGGVPVIMVAHSWGTVMSKIALEGGDLLIPTPDPTTGEPTKRSIAKPFLKPMSGKVDYWLTIGSPLGESAEGRQTPDVKMQGCMTDGMSISYTLTRPRQVRNWVNMYDRNDTVSKYAPTLPIDGPQQNLPIGNPVNYTESILKASEIHRSMWIRSEVVKQVFAWRDKCLAEWKSGTPPNTR